MQSFEVPWRAWFGDERYRLDFPDSSNVRVYEMAGAAPLSDPELESALARSIEAPSLDQLARTKSRVAIAIDDLSRPTPAHRILPNVLKTLLAAGVPDDHIRIIVGLGSHTPLTEEQIAKKVGAEVASRITIENHNCENNLVEIGIKVGTVSVRVNRTFAQADLKILLGSVVPHAFAGFSGGAKMVLPGLSDIDSIEWTHKAVLMGFRGKAGSLEGNRFREEFGKVARHLGVQLSINVVVNQCREICGVFVGETEIAHREAARFARQVYATPIPEEPLDVVVLNAYPKDDELLQAESALMFHHTAPEGYLSEKGLLLISSACSLGMGHHGLFGPGQRVYRTPARKSFLKNRLLAGLMPGIGAEDFHQIYWEGYPFFDDGRSTYSYLREEFPRGARVGIVPCGSIQIAAPKSQIVH